MWLIDISHLPHNTHLEDIFDNILKSAKTGLSYIAILLTFNTLLCLGLLWRLADKGLMTKKKFKQGLELIGVYHFMRESAFFNN